MYLLIDVGYLMFYRYYATKLWYRRAHSDDPTDLEDVEDHKDQPDLKMVQTSAFKDMYIRRIESSIQELVSRYGTDWKNVFFCCDCPRAKIWRMQLHPVYKACRDGKVPSGIPIAAGYLQETLDRLRSEYGCAVLRVPTAEADDIVYVTRKSLLEANASASFTIVASDADYHQICEANTQLVRFDGRDAMKGSSRNREDVTDAEAPMLDLQVKIIAGDTSDNIPAITARCGPKTALRLARSSSVLSHLFQTDPSAQERYARNTKLIDMRKIPVELQETIHQLVFA